MLFRSKVDQYTVTNIIDYSEFAKEGIFVTESNSVNFDYIPIATISSYSQASFELNTLFTTSNSLNIDNIFKEVTTKLKSINANGLINLKMNYFNEGKSVSISGMAIKINDPINNLIALDKFDLTPKNIDEAVVDEILCIIIERKPSGVIIASDISLSPSQIKKAVSVLKLTGLQTRFVVPNSKQFYAGTTENGYLVNYMTNEFIKLSDIE